MKTYPEEARKAVAEAERRAAVALHRLVRPFLRENTAQWRERERIRNALIKIKENADEASLCLEPDHSDKDLTQASTAIKELEMNTHGLMGRMPKGNSGGHHDWVSRDYADLDCQATGCMFNHAKKCMVPSKCKIAPDGRCEGFQAKPPPKTVDGD